MLKKINASKPLRLLHIPKTAGTTVASALLRVYGRKSFFAFTGIVEKDRANFSNLDSESRKAFRLFIGHSMYDTGIPEADHVEIFTMLREPVSRVKSFIQHVASGKSSYLKDYATSRPFAIDEFLASGNGELENLQTKMLINKDDSPSNARIEELGDQVALDLAFSRLKDGMIAFGIQEDFDASWVAIWNALGRRAPLYASLNRKKDAALLNFTPGQLERIRELNQLDLKLYEAAHTEFQRRRESGQIPVADVKAFTRRQQTIGKAFSWGWSTARKIIKKPIN